MLRFNRVGFEYGAGGRHALNDITLELRAGESVVVLGGNGSGKSTLLLLAAGLLRPTSGEIVRSIENGAGGAVLQNPDDQIVTVSLERELAFPLECRELPASAIRERVTEMLNWSGFLDRRFDSPNNLSGGEKQKLALAASIISVPGLLVLDEPSSHLDAKGSEMLRNSVERARIDNPDLIVIEATQDGEDCLEFDRAVVLRRGELVADDSPTRILSNIKSCSTWNIAVPDVILSGSVDEHALPAVPDSSAGGDSPNSTIDVKNLKYSWGDKREVFRGLNLRIASDRITGVAAPSGGGKTTLGLLLSGLVRPGKGMISICGEPVTTDELRAYAVYVFQFPERQFFMETVRDEVSFGLLQAKMSRDSAFEKSRDAIEVAGLPYDLFAERSPFDLSGGEMRRVAIATALALDRRLLILDEPTASLDADGIERCRGVIMAMKKRNKTVVVISHDTSFLFEVCDDLVILQDGEVNFQGDKFSVLSNAGIFERSSLPIPEIVKLCINPRIRIVVENMRIGSVSQLLDAME